MMSRITRAIFLVAIVIPLSGCPTASIELGLWGMLVHFDGGLIHFHSIVLLPGGETEPADPPINGFPPLDGTVTWSQFGSRVTFVQEVDSSTTYRLSGGDIESSTKISDGTLSQNGVGVIGDWSADKDLIP